jgi:hypothetical protein
MIRKDPQEKGITLKIACLSELAVHNSLAGLPTDQGEKQTAVPECAHE